MEFKFDKFNPDDPEELSRGFARMVTHMARLCHTSEFTAAERASAAAAIDDPETIIAGMKEGRMEMMRRNLNLLQFRLYSRNGFSAEIAYPLNAPTRELDDLVKEGFAVCIRLIAGICDVELFVSSVEAWVAVVDPKMDKAIRDRAPSQREDRDEVVLYIAETKRRQLGRMFKIVRDADAKPLDLVPHEPFDVDSDANPKNGMSGRFAGVLFDIDARTTTRPSTD